jgi:mannose-6-phosphate isomerase-like protein (cupin superfamily)/GNAT superfamily N-acetyltransferase
MGEMGVVNVSEAFGRFEEQWHPQLLGVVNDMAVKAVKVQGEFIWHHHDEEDELFLVVRGRLRMRFRDRDVVVNEGEFIIVPRGVEHMPVAETETRILLFEPRTMVNTGNVVSERTVTAAPLSDGRPAARSGSVTVRPYLDEDRPFIESLAERLTIGMPPWRDEGARLAAVRRWIAASLDDAGELTTVLVVVDTAGEPLGFATLTEEIHFTGERQAYIGELAVSEAAEGLGAGRALVDACEAWARAAGYRVITLVTGAQNRHALGFYSHLGYRDEDIRLVSLLD